MQALADVLYYMHIVVLVLVLSPFFLPAGRWMQYVIILICLILLDWHFPLDDRRCSLTSLESKTRGTWDGRIEGDHETAPAFWYPLINDIFKPFGVRLSRKQATSLNYVVFVCSLLVAFLKLQAYTGDPVSFRGPAGNLAAGGAIIMAAVWIIDGSWNPGGPS